MSKQIMTIYRSAWYSTNVANAVTKVELNTASSTHTGNLSYSNNAIKIGAGISKIKVSARLSFDMHDWVGEVDIIIMKNNTTPIYLFGGEEKAKADTASVIMPLILDVQENDEIALAYCKSDSKLLHILAGLGSNLTVEVIK